LLAQQKYRLMENRKTPFSINLIYYVTQFLFYLAILASCLYAIFNIALYAGLTDQSYQLNLELPVKFDVIEKAKLNMNDTNLTIEIIKANAQVHFINAPNFIGQNLFWWVSASLLIAIYMIWLFRKFISNVRIGIIFNYLNIDCLKKIAYSLVGFWLFSTAYSVYFYQYIINKLEFETISLSPGINYSVGHLQAALLIWVLAHIFSVGLKLQEEQSLTI
jgi:hypothetical protein